MNPEREKVLDRMPIKRTGLPENPVHRKWAIESRQMATRDALIFKQWLKADDKEKAIDEIAEKFGLRSSGRVRSIIKKQRQTGAAVAVYAAEIEGIKQIRSAQVLNAGDQAQAELDELYQHYCDLRDKGEEWITTKIVTKTGANEGVTVETIPVHEAVTRVLEMKLKRYKEEADALEPYSGIRATKPYEKGERAGLEIYATAEFLAEWNRLKEMANKPTEIEVDINEEN